MFPRSFCKTKTEGAQDVINDRTLCWKHIFSLQSDLFEGNNLPGRQSLAIFFGDVL